MNSLFCDKRSYLLITSVLMFGYWQKQKVSGIHILSHPEGHRVSYFNEARSRGLRRPEGKAKCSLPSG